MEVCDSMSLNANLCELSFPTVRVGRQGAGKAGRAGRQALPTPGLGWSCPGRPGAEKAGGVHSPSRQTQEAARSSGKATAPAVASSLAGLLG